MFLIAIEELQVNARMLLGGQLFAAVGDAKVAGLRVFDTARVLQMGECPAHPICEAKLSSAGEDLSQVCFGESELAGHTGSSLCGGVDLTVAGKSEERHEEALELWH